MTVQVGLCRTCSETTLLVFPRGGSIISGVDLLLAVDRWKCQTLFLSQISQKALRRAIFPVGGLQKDVVKQIARDAGLEKIAQRKEVCFEMICFYHWCNIA